MVTVSTVGASVLLFSLCKYSVNHRALPFLMNSFRLTLQSPFIENEDAEVRVRVETRTTDWSLLYKCGVSDIGEWTKGLFTHGSLITHIPQLRTSFAGYWRFDQKSE